MTGVFSLLRCARRHTWRERTVLGSAAVVCVCMWGALRIMSLRRLVRWTGKTSARTWTADRPMIDHIAWAARTAGHHLFPARPCLPQALAARFLLTCLGVPTDLHIGVRRRDEDGLGAHAWLEYEDEVLVGGSDASAQYHRLAAS